MELSIQRHDIDAMRAFTKDALRHYSNEGDELHRRRMLLGRLELDLTTPVECFGILSAVMGDTQGWAYALEKLGADCDPGYGYLAWRSIQFYLKDERQTDEWFFAADMSASNGHFPARQEVLRRRLKRASLVFKPWIAIQLIFLEMRRRKLVKLNFEDRRLTKFSEPNT